MKIPLATRGSNLALWQANTTAAALGTTFTEHEFPLHVVHSSGDRDLTTELAQFGTTGIFTVEIDLALLRGEARIGVHSLKDMSTALHADLVLAAVLPRGSVEDVLVGASLEDLDEGARVATGSRRRGAMLLAERGDLQVVPIRGNVETRLRKIAEGEADATIMARAGLERLGYEERIASVLPKDIFVPAPGQGIVGIVCRADDAEARVMLAAINDPTAWACAVAERTFLRVLEGGCSAPIGGHATIQGDEIELHGRVLSADGSSSMETRGSTPVEQAEMLGMRLASALLEQGARKLIEGART